jgi:hypothetical protein
MSNDKKEQNNNTTPVKVVPTPQFVEYVKKSLNPDTGKKKD